MNEPADEKSTHCQIFACASCCIGLGLLVATIVKLAGGKELDKGDLTFLYISLLITVCCVCTCCAWACGEEDGSFSGCCPVFILGILGLTGVITNMPFSVALWAVILTAGCTVLGCCAMCWATLCGVYLSRSSEHKSGRSKTFLVRPGFVSNFEPVKPEPSDESIV